MSLPLCVLVISLGTAIGTARGSCRCASALAVLAPVWILANGPMEGHVLWTLDREHGLTTADLLTIPMLIAAAFRLRRSAERGRWLAARSAESTPERIAPHGVALTRGALTRGALIRVSRGRVRLTRLGGRRGPAGSRSGARLSDSGLTGARTHGATAPHGLAGGRASRLAGRPPGTAGGGTTLRRLSVSAQVRSIRRADRAYRSLGPRPFRLVVHR